MISYKHKCIFIHIPKNAGESIEILFKCYRKKENLWGLQNGKVLQHMNVTEMKDIVGSKIFNSYFKFSFVRNPFSKCLSEYFWEKNHLCESLDFTTWVKLNLDNLIKKSANNKEAMRQAHNLEQYKFLYNEHGNLDVDFIGRFENLQADFNIICNKIGIPRQELPHKNPSKHKHYTEYYDDETKEIVAEKYAKDIEYFGYEFGD